jgi:thioredoxin reductase (NADPH)
LDVTTSLEEERIPLERFDIGIVGAGPCGIAAGVAARELGLDCVLFDRGAVTQAMLEHPTYTTYFSGPEKLEIADLPFTTAGDKPTRRETVRYYRRVVGYFGLRVRQFEEVTGISGARGEFSVRTRTLLGEEHTYAARAVVIATGYYDTPKRLGIPGDDLPTVSHYFKEPFPYFDQNLVVIGGGNSAADAALTCWREGARVTLIHLFDELDKGVKPWVRPDIDNRIAEGSIPALWRHRVAEIRAGEVEVEDLETGSRRTIPAQWVLAMTGYVPDTGFLERLGVRVDPETGIPTHDPRTMQTNVPGIYIAGVIAAGFDANKIFIENGKLHGPLIARSAAEAQHPKQ